MRIKITNSSLSKNKNIFTLLCPGCNKTLPPTNFYRNPSGKNSASNLGRHFYCISCTKKKQVERKQKKLLAEIGDYWLFHYRHLDYHKIWQQVPGFGNFDDTSIYFKFPELSHGFCSFFVPIHHK